MNNRNMPLSILSESIIRALAYYDLFDHPLTASEVFANLPTNHVTLADIERELQVLASTSKIFRLGSFYSLRNNGGLESKRKNGNAMAKEYMMIAVRQARLIARFPFVRSIMISGSLSKGYADDQSDIDFFIVTTPGRLWITRTLLVLYKRLFLFNSHKYFCVNYFVDTNHLQIEEKNIFTATELATLIPLYGSGYHSELLKQNKWLWEFFPNFQPNPSTDTSSPNGTIKRFVEWLLNHCFPGIADNLLMKLTSRRWKKMYSHIYPASDFGIAFKTNRHVSKNHPNYYQRKIVTRYEERILALRYLFAKTPA